MNRRIFLKLLAVLLGESSFPIIAGADPSSANMNNIDIDTWTLALPKDWVLDKKESIGIPYFESTDGTKGSYIKSLRLPPTNKLTPAEAAMNIQRVHRQSFEKDPKSSWRVMRDENLNHEALAASLLDLFDKKNNYRVVSKVLVSGEVAVQLTLHDYYCQDYEASVRLLSPVIESLRPR